MPDDGAADLAPQPLHRADVEAMVACLVAQLLARRHHGELRFVPPDAGPDAGRWSMRTPGGGWRDVHPERVRHEVRHLLDGLASLRWGLAPGYAAATPELADIAEAVAVSDWMFRGFRAGLLREEFVAEVEVQARHRCPCPCPELEPVDDGGGAWDGLPPAPSADGWHDLGYAKGTVTARWRAALRCWDLGAGLACCAEVARLACYGGPADALCILPAEREAGRWPAWVV